MVERAKTMEELLARAKAQGKTTEQIQAAGQQVFGNTSQPTTTGHVASVSQTQANAQTPPPATAQESFGESARQKGMGFIEQRDQGISKELSGQFQTDAELNKAIQSRIKS